MIGVGLAGLLVTAAILTPDPRGRGTHEQLGLPPCTFAIVMGFRCPGCGMTTAWSHLARGRVGEAASTHLAGTLLGLMAMATSVWALACATVGERRIKWPSDRTWVFVAAVIAALVLVEWVVRLASQGFGAAA